VMWFSTKPADGSGAWREFRPGSPGPAYAIQVGTPHVRGFSVVIRFKAIGLPGARASADAYLLVPGPKRNKFIIVGSGKITLTAHHVKTLTVRLNAKGQTLLRIRHRLTAQLDAGPTNVYEITWTAAGQATITG